MLKRLAIRNYALIDDLDISFSGELNILTGETGAGKSIILGALSLILGQRTEGRHFFNQQKKCIIEGTFHITGFPLQDFFREHELDYDDETLLRREISADGRSRSFINDTPVNLPVLKKLGEKLIDVHSQHATLEINDESFQMLVVDTIAGNGELLAQYQETFSNFRRKQKQLRELTEESQRSKADLDYYQFLFDELDKASLATNEQEDLEQELNSLTHAEDIKRNLLTVTGILRESELPVVSQLKEAVNSLAAIEKFKPEIRELQERLNSSLIEIKDILSEVDDLEQKSMVDPGRLEEINERLGLIYSLQKKHRVSTIAELETLRDDLSQKLNGILFAEEDIETMKTELEDIRLELTALAGELHTSRQKAIPVVEEKIRETLGEVGMPNAVLTIVDEMNAADKFESQGMDQIRFMFSANKGQAPLPVSKVASGGELSRLMLSIKSLIAVHTALPTIIFDEIDTGISGEVALKVGRVIENLSRNMQVIAISHLPQIAARGKSHFIVYKDEDSETTRTNIRKLVPEERVIEIARMLSGNNPGESAIMNAKELLG